MSIHFISGKPGGGKSLYEVKLIIDELVHGRRHIVTNVPLILPRLYEYISEKYPSVYADRFLRRKRNGECVPAHIQDMLTILHEDQLSSFFTFRSSGLRLDSISNAEWKSGKRPDFSKVLDGGVFYVLDEVHIAFNSRAWADTGHEVLYYLSQHRKLGDDVICITQSIGNVDKQFRSVAQDFTYLKNLSKQRAGLFRLPAYFLRSTYAQPATENSKAMESGSFKLDVTGIASCYDTAKGVGIHGRGGADTSARKKGLHWAWFLVCFPLLVFSFVHYSPGLIVRFLNRGQPVASSAVSARPVVASVSVLSASVVDPPKSLNGPILSETNQPVTMVTGLISWPNHDVWAMLSDGSKATSFSGRLTFYSARYCVIDGVHVACLDHADAGDYVPQFVPPLRLPSPSLDRPINQADVTVIGQAYRNRRATPISTGNLPSQKFPGPALP